jgi:hypothetical protein
VPNLPVGVALQSLSDGSSYHKRLVVYHRDTAACPRRPDAVADFVA